MKNVNVRQKYATDCAAAIVFGVATIKAAVVTFYLGVFGLEVQLIL